ncbi:MAG: hypothetical protein LC099_04135 [Anaerolineales bacterium]|nr:hypothetical protein [Anaerolineales bacterium]
MSRDLRKYARDTNVRIAVGAVLLLLLVGLGLVDFIYGAGAALTGFLCLLGALLPIGLIVLILFGMDWFVKHANSDDERSD